MLCGGEFFNPASLYALIRTWLWPFAFLPVANSHHRSWVQYKDAAAAAKAKSVLHGMKWPSTHGKNLQVEYADRSLLATITSGPVPIAQRLSGLLNGMGLCRPNVCLLHPEPMSVFVAGTKQAAAATSTGAVGAVVAAVGEATGERAPELAPRPTLVLEQLFKKTKVVKGWSSQQSACSRSALTLPIGPTPAILFALVRRASCRQANSGHCCYAGALSLASGKALVTRCCKQLLTCNAVPGGVSQCTGVGQLLPSIYSAFDCCSFFNVSLKEKEI